MDEMSETMQSLGDRDYRRGELRCDGCGEQAALFAPGWRAYGSDDAYTDELPALAFFCPRCAPDEPASS
jgi:hypothetical protein